MATAVHGVWAIDIGSNALKALQMQEGEDGLEVLDCAYFEHSHNLSSGEVSHDEKEGIIEETLRKFLDEKDLSKCEVAISIAGQNSFARFINLPPVDAKKIPEVVQFEAIQQIPFDINEVEWDWQLMEAEDSPEKRVGLFAIKNELIAEVMDHFTKENLRVACVQIAPMALYNYVYCDIKEIQSHPDKAIVILDIGAENTTLVVCTRDSVWQRSIRIGGNTFTEAIADAFRKNFATAEKLKRTAPMSKYMRQIYTAMKSVYTDLGGEIQRSLGFYSSSTEGRDKTLTRVVALGGGMKLQGLSKYLTQTLGMKVIKPDSFETLKLAPEVSTAKFHENISDFGIAYGLGAQLLGEAKIHTNLLPRKIARAMAWTRKARMFTIAASILLFACVLAFGTTYKTLIQYDSKPNTDARTRIKGIQNEINKVKDEISTQEARREPFEDKINKIMGTLDYRDTVPSFMETLVKCLPSKENNPDQMALYDDLEDGNAIGVLEVDRDRRKVLNVTAIAVDYSQDVTLADFPELQRGTPGFFQPQPRGGFNQRERQDRRGPIPEELMLAGGGGPGSTNTQEEQEENNAGFTILIEGYSPYRNIADLLDPPGVGNDKSRWGFVTRLKNLEKLNSDIPFKLYTEPDAKHFDMKIGLVDLADKEMPAGIGVRKTVERTPRPTGASPGMTRMYAGNNDRYLYKEDVLFDPMTNEEISKVQDIITREEIDKDPKLTDDRLGEIQYDRFGNKSWIERDHWFRIRAKFIWKDAPEAPVAEGVKQGM